MATSDSIYKQLLLAIQGAIVEIPLTQGYTALVDAVDANLITLKWQVRVCRHAPLVYAYHGMNRVGEPRNVAMHHMVMRRMLNGELPQGKEVDHVDGNGLNNRRYNLRLATPTENMQNKSLYRNNKSGVRGVSWHKRDKSWSATIRVNNRLIHLGYFDEIEDAANARIVAELEYFGEFSPTLSRSK